MLAYTSILGAALAGYFSVPAYVIAGSIILLTSISYAEHGRTYQRARELGLSDAADFVMLRSLLNAALASGAAYGFGVFMWLI